MSFPAPFRHNRFSCLTLSLAVGLLASACSTTPSDHFYTLIGNTASLPVSDGVAVGPSVAITSVTLPEAVDRSEIVVRSGANRVLVMETQRWAESLKAAIPRAVASDLSAMLGGAIVSVQTDNASRDAKYAAWIDITRFDSALGEAATIDAMWSVRPSAGGTAKSGRASWRIPVHGAGIDELVAAHGAALAQLSTAIAKQINELENPRN